MDPILLTRILTGEASNEEKETFYAQLGGSKEEEELFYKVKSLWLRSSLNKKNLDVDSEFDRIWNKIKHPVNHTTYFNPRKLIQYAAIVMFVLGLGGFSGYIISVNIQKNIYSGVQKFTALKGSVSIVEFPDGTKVWLNSGTELSYHEDGKQRLAELTGEAYFEINHKEDSPFSVKANQIVVRDLGTTFNLKAYSDDSFVETSLIEGKVEILDGNDHILAKLKPGESARYFTEDKKIEIGGVSQNAVSAWREGKFVIRDQRLEDIFKKLGRWYDCEFQFENPSLRDYRYTGNIKKSTTAQQVMKMLKLTANFKYRIIEKQTAPDVIIIY